MLIALPLLAFTAVFLVLLGRDAGSPEEHSWQGSFLLASALWGAALVAMTEGLSLFTAIGRPGVVAGWTAVLLGALVWGRSRGILAPGWRRLHSLAADLNKFEVALLVVIGALALVLLAVVFAAPVNTVDVLQYHMPRVLQWAQNGSLDHFPTANASQNNRPYWAEAVMLHLRLLWGDDTPVELVNWFAWLGLAIPAAATARLLGSDRARAWLAAVFAWTLPTTVLHATTAMVDLPAAYWAASLGYFVLGSLDAGLGRGKTLGVGLTLGLGMLTKGTFFPFAAALMALWGLWLMGRRSWRGLFLKGALVAMVAMVLNVGFWARNFQSYGGPYGRSIAVQPLGEPVGELQPEAGVSPSGDGDRLGGALIDQGQKLLRMGLLHFVTPVGAVNQRLFGLMERLPDVFPPSYLGPMRAAAWNNVMTGGSPVHWVLALGAILGLMIVAWRSDRTIPKVAIGYGLALLAGFLLLSAVNFAGSVFGTRYQLPFLALAAPLIGLAAPPARSWLYGAAMGIAVIYAMPYTLLNHTRPVVSLTPWPTKIESVLLSKQEVILFAQSPTLLDEYSFVSDRTLESGCREVGLMVNAKDLEYTMWWLLDFPDSGGKLGHWPEPVSFQRHGEKEFVPCAVICTICDGEKPPGLLQPSLDAGHIILYESSPSSFP